MRMIYGGLKKKSQLPSSCPFPSGGMDCGFKCGASFKDGQNLYQDTDLIVHCAKCGVSLGQFEPNAVPYSFNKNNMIMRDDNIGHGMS